MKRIVLLTVAMFLSYLFAAAQVWVGGESGSLLISKDGGNNYTAVDAPGWEYFGFYQGADDTTFIAANADGSHGGRILKTADDGASFYDTVVSDEDMTNYTKVGGDILKFPGTEAYMVIKNAGNGRNLIMYDAKNNYWNKEGKMNGNQIMDIVSASSSNGYGVTALNIWKTENAGDNWDESYSIPEFNDVAVFGNGNIVAIGPKGRVSFSDDGGANFSSPSGISETENLNEIEVAPSGSEGLIVGNNGSIWKTTDNGVNWTSVTSPDSKNLQSIAYADNSTVLIGGGEDSEEDPNIHRSTDGGDSWTEIPAGNFDFSQWIAGDNNDPLVQDIHFSDVNNGWLVVVSSYHDAKSYVMQTSDAGQTWNITADTTAYKELNFNKSYAIWGIDDSTAFVTSQNNLYKTTDTGSTWSEVDYDNAPTGWAIEDMYFKNADSGYFICGNSYYGTTDGGDTWSEVNSEVGNTYLKGMGDSLIVGTKAYIAETNDGGTTWNQMDVVGFPGDFNSVDASGPDDAVAVGNNGYMLLTNDGGSSWNSAGNPSAFTFDFADVQLFGPDTIFAVSKAGYTVKTTDGGTNWVMDTIDEGASLALNDMDMPYLNMAIVVGDGGVMYKTDDWNTWTEVNSGTSNNLNHVDYSDTTNYCADPAEPTITIHQDSASCSNSTDGMAWVDITGGVSPFSYTWNDAENTQKDTLKGVKAGNYEVTITDVCGISYTMNTTIYEPAPLNLDMGADSVSTVGGSDGSAWVDVTGGTPEYSYLWSDADSTTNDTLSNVSSEKYTVTVTDANGCVAENTITVPGPGVGIEMVSSSEVSVYPVPSNGIINITGATGEQIKVIDALGNVVYNEQADESIEQIDLSGEPGVYIVHINDRAIRVVIK